MNIKKQGYAKAIKLQRWQSPVEDVLLLFSERICIVYFFVRDDSGNGIDESCIGKLEFHGAHAVRSSRTEVLPYYDHDHVYHSSILEVFDSKWREEALAGVYSEKLAASILKTLRHFIVAGHDIYHEIAAESYVEQYIQNGTQEFLFATRQLGVD